MEQNKTACESLASSISSPNTARKRKCDFFIDGSVSSAVVNLCSATLGAGVLSLPYAISQSGLVPGIMLLLLAGIATYATIDFLVIVLNSLHGISTYESLTQHLFGPYLRFLVEFCILIFCWGCATAYIIAVGDIMQTILPASISRRLCMVVFWTIIMFPLSSLRRVNSMRYASFIGITSIFVLIGSVIFHSIQEIATPQHHFTVKLWPSSLTDLIRSCPIVLFAFSCQINVPTIYAELNNSSPSHFRIVTRYAVLICFIAYLLVSVFAYLNFGEVTQEDILGNYCSLDAVMTTAFLCITLGVTLAFPLNIFPSRITLHGMLARGTLEKEKKEDDDPEKSETDFTFLLEQNGNDDDEFSMSPTLSFILTLALTGSALIAALIVPDISTVFGLLGGTASSTICFIMPALFYIKVKLSTSCQHVTSYFWPWALFFGGVTIGVVSTGVTLYSMFEKHKTDSPCQSN